MKAQEMIDYAKQNNCENLISQVFYTQDRRFAFQRVGRGYNVYGGEGYSFIRYFTSFGKMCDFFKEQGV